VEWNEAKTKKKSAGKQQELNYHAEQLGEYSFSCKECVFFS